MRRILIEVPEPLFSSSWRILEPHGRAVLPLAHEGRRSMRLTSPEVQSVELEELGGMSRNTCSDTGECCGRTHAQVCAAVNTAWERTHGSGLDTTTREQHRDTWSTREVVGIAALLGQHQELSEVDRRIKQRLTALLIYAVLDEAVRRHQGSLAHRSRRMNRRC